MSPVFARPWITVGIGLAGTALVAASPATSPLPRVEIPTIELTAAEFDPITPWTDVIDHSASNLGGLFDQVSTAPLFPVLQQVAINQIGYASSLLDGSGDLGTIVTEMGGNVQNLLSAPFGFAPGLLSSDDGTISGSIFGWTVLTKAVGHDDVFGALRALSSISPELRSLLDFTASPASGLLLGAVGPVVGPGVALGTGIGSAVDHASDPLTVLNDLVDIPAHMVDAFLNGGPTLDSIPLFDAVGIPTQFEIPFLARASIDTMGLTMGGILSPQGSLFNAFDFTGSAGLLNIGDWSALGGVFDLPGNDVGALGTLIGLPETLATSIGWNGHGLLDELLGGSLFSGSPSSLLDLGLAELMQQPLTDVAQLLGSDLAELLGGDITGLLGNGVVADLTSVIPNLLLSVLG